MSALADRHTVKDLIDSVRPLGHDQRLNVPAKRKRPRKKRETTKQSEARWERIFRAKFADPTYYTSPRPSSNASSLRGFEEF